nr:DDE-type integrase/transposase/recombinase [Roseomonas aerilata]
MMEQDHRRLKHLIRAGLGFGGFHTARRTLMAHEAMAMVRKGQVRAISGCEMSTQASFVDKLFQAAALPAARHGRRNQRQSLQL